MDEKTIRILLVEDNAGDARLLREMLNEPASCKYELTHRDSMEKAVTHLAESPEDIILRDLGLPDAHSIAGLAHRGITVKQGDRLLAQAMLNILIVDDNAGDRKTVTLALEQAGLSCECVETANIEQALDACGKYAFDCAIVDYRMPGHDGLYGITALHERLPYMALIMASGEGDEMVAAEAIKRGASDYISKTNIRAESLKRIIEDARERTTLRQKVTQQREELDNFARVLVHDLKAPICSIQGFGALIELLLSEGKFENIGEHCRNVVKAARRMDAMIDTLHEYTIADTQVAFERLEMDLALEDTLKNLEHLIQERGARVTHSDLPAVIGNDSQLIQLLQNLIGNGVKYCSAAIPSVHVAAVPQKEAKWLFSVKDNGIGISEEYHNTVFEPFKRLHGVSEYEGTGLGLATCKKIVERHGGVIWCESAEGEGTTFLFTLRGADNRA